MLEWGAKGADRNLISVYQHSEFRKSIDILIQSCKYSKESLALLLLDIDNLRIFNDKYGYNVGDLILEKVGRLLTDVLPKNALLYRCGNDEFAMIVKGIEDHEIRFLCQYIRDYIFDHVTFHWMTERCNVSIGVSFFPEHGSKSDDLIRKADLALTRAKQNNTQRSTIYKDIFKILQQNPKEQDQTLMTTINILLTIIDAKDNYTMGHSCRVTEYSILLGKSMGLSEEELTTLKYSSLFHDIGKIEIEEEILTKKDRLEEEEFLKIKKHPILGHSIIKSLHHASIQEDIILYHHERIDGQGYPYGLGGEEIPLMARVVAIADSFDAMTSNRPYSHRKSIAAAIEELRKCAKKQFDKELVETFVDEILKNDRDF